MEPRGRARTLLLASAVTAGSFVAASFVAEGTLLLAGKPGTCLPSFALTYLILAALCLGLAPAFRVDLGFRRCSRRALLTPALYGVPLGGGASALALAVGFSMPGCIRELNLLQIALLTWVLASLAEELLTRGLFQGMLSSPPQPPIRGEGLHWSVVASAAFFAAMHLPLLAMTTNWRGVAILVAFAFTLGLLAGRARRATASLWPAVAVHSAFNIGGALVGVLAYALGQGGP